MPASWLGLRPFAGPPREVGRARTTSRSAGVLAVAAAVAALACARPAQAQVLAPPVAPLSGRDPSLAEDGFPLAGYHSGLFYLRDTEDNYRLYLQGRAHLDFYGYFGPGVGDTSLKPTLFLRRARPEFSGELFHSWWFMIAGDFGATAIDNPRGSNETSAAAPGMLPTANSGRYASAQSVKISAAPTDVFLNYRAAPFLNVQVGQFDAPFTMENRTSEKWGTPFMERSLTVRDVAVPTQKQLGVMLWGEAFKILNYAVGLFDGDGQNRPNVDSRGDLFARAYVTPLVNRKDALKNFEVGASLRYGSRDPKYVAYDVPALTTQGQYAFWNPTYTGSRGLTHVIYSGRQRGVALEARLPVGLVDLTAEAAFIDKGTREAEDGSQATPSVRFGSLRGQSYYLELGYWPLGNRDINGLPGVQNMPHVDFTKPDKAPERALQLLVKWEQVRLGYASARRGGRPDAKNMDGEIRVDALSLGANYWLTKHLRFTVNYVVNLFPHSAPVTAVPPGGPIQSSTQRAAAPGNTLAPGLDDDARSNAHVLHEALARFAVAF